MLSRRKRVVWSLCRLLGTAKESKDRLEESDKRHCAKISTETYLIDCAPTDGHHQFPSFHHHLSATMGLIPFTLLLFALFQSSYAGSVNIGGNCTVGDNRLQAGTYQFWSDCDAVSFCSDAGVCTAKRCRRDEFPFGYQQGADLPPKCPKGQFCPDEGSDCQPLLPVGSPCQLNRDGKKSDTSPCLSISNVLCQINARVLPTPRTLLIPVAAVSM